MKQTVAIVGRGKTWNLAPFDDECIQIWSLNDHPMRAMLPRESMHFELHDDALDADRYGEDYKNWLQTRRIPVVMKNPDRRIPAAIRLPQMYFGGLYKGGEQVKNITSSVPYMIACAVHWRYERIELFGVELATDNEKYAGHRESVLYWIGRANGCGVDVAIPAESELYHACDYP